MIEPGPEPPAVDALPLEGIALGLEGATALFKADVVSRLTGLRIKVSISPPSLSMMRSTLIVSPTRDFDIAVGYANVICVDFQIFWGP